MYEYISSSLESERPTDGNPRFISVVQQQLPLYIVKLRVRFDLGTCNLSVRRQ
jgi:hypothetical protein